jgi:hypothetical protein
VAAASLVSELTAASSGRDDAALDLAPMDIDARISAYRLRRDPATGQCSHPAPACPTDGDAGRYADGIASYSTCLPHDDLGVVEPWRRMRSNSKAAIHTSSR